MLQNYHHHFVQPLNPQFAGQGLAGTYKRTGMYMPAEYAQLLAPQGIDPHIQYSFIDIIEF